MDTQTLITNLAIAFFSGIGPVVAIIVTGRQRREENIQTWARQDQVAEAAQQVAVRVDGVHTLVNNAMTVEKERALLLLRASLSRDRVTIVLLNELGRFDEVRRYEADVKMLEEEIRSLETELQSRARQLELAGPDIQEIEDHPVR